ncbi:MAG: NADP-dependent phosphogluconate dehydrogenase [Burkholderiaceae bacterium]
MSQMQIGLVGLGVMGENLALNLLRHGCAISGFDLDDVKLASFGVRTQGQSALAVDSLEQLVASLPAPRCIWLMVPAGSAVDAVLAQLQPLLSAGDVVIDGGNTLYTDTERRMTALHSSGIHYVGLGVSGGEAGALNGPALMPGGDALAWPRLQPLLQAIAAKAEDGQPCCEWMGPGGSGHFVKMVHNGIEYADMQTICEAYDLMQNVLGMSAREMSDCFRQWNQGELSSYLMGITADILAYTDPETGQPLVDLILDSAEQKGTGRWASQVALDLGVATPTLVSAVLARTLSSLKTERLQAAQVLCGPASPPLAEREQVLEKIKQSLLAAKICAYAQGFGLLRAADRHHQWQLPLRTVASVWRAGCIIRARLLDNIRQAYEHTPDLSNLLLDSHFSSVLADCQQSLRDVVAMGAQHGVAIPSFMSSLSYYDGYRSARLPANLLQAQRDYFGAHTYQRLDRPGQFHSP